MPFFDIFASPRWSLLRMHTKVVSFFIFFQELSTKKKIKALRPKMTKIASRGGGGGGVLPKFSLKPEQFSCLSASLLGESVVAVLPTAFGKSLIYQLFPQAWSFLDRKRTGQDRPCTVLVLSPLVALMRDQVHRARKMGLTSAKLVASTASSVAWAYSDPTTTAVTSSVTAGHYQLLFTSSEALLTAGTKSVGLPWLSRPVFVRWWWRGSRRTWMVRKLNVSNILVHAYARGTVWNRRLIHSGWILPHTPCITELETFTVELRHHYRPISSQPFSAGCHGNRNWRPIWKVACGQESAAVDQECMGSNASSCSFALSFLFDCLFLPEPVSCRGQRIARSNGKRNWSFNQEYNHLWSGGWSPDSNVFSSLFF